MVPLPVADGWTTHSFKSLRAVASSFYNACHTAYIRSICLIPPALHQAHPLSRSVAVPSLTRKSVILISPQNQVLLLHRVRTSSSFPSAHVFPGGNVSTFHDGQIPPSESEERHQDSEVYRLAAIRETFEESGILLARNNGFGRLLEVEDGEREEGRRKVHAGEIEFTRWLAGKGGRADTGEPIPWTGSCLNIRHSHELTLRRRPNTLHALDHTHKHPQTIHHPDVHLLPASCKLSTQHRLLDDLRPGRHRHDDGF